MMQWKHWPTAVAIVGLLAATSKGAEAPAKAERTFRAGAAAVDITPRLWPVALIGSFSYRPAESAADPLMARALVLDDGTDRLAIVIVDSCYVHRDVLDEAKRRAATKAGIPSERILVGATHTHSAPPGDGRQDTEQHKDYQRVLIDGIAQSIEQAAAKLQPAQIGWGSSPLPDEVFNRRWFMKPGTIPPDPFGGTTDLVKMNPPGGSPNLINPSGPIDPDVWVISVRTPKGKPIALLANYSLHYVGGQPPGVASSDYFGEFARLAKNRLQSDKPIDDFVGILSNGTSGNINNIDFRTPRPPREPFEQIRIVAGKTADAAYRAYRSLKHRDWVDLAMTERIVTLNLRQPTDDQVAKAKSTLSAPDEKSLPGLAKSYAERLLKLAERGATVDIKLQAIRIGELGVAAIPFEVFVEIGLELKEKSPLPSTFTIELANGGEGYLPTPEHHKLGGYETWLTTNRVQEDASRIITDAILQMFQEVTPKSEGK